LTGDFRTETITISEGEVRPVRAIPRRCGLALGHRGAISLEVAMLTVDDIAARLRCSVRTGRRYAEAWLARQRDLRVPRVEQRRSGRRGRPAYVIDRDSFERWLCPVPQAEAA
jgi:hypothetical protein